MVSRHTYIATTAARLLEALVCERARGRYEHQSDDILLIRALELARDLWDKAHG